MESISNNNIKNLLEVGNLENESIVEEINGEVFGNDLYIILNDDNIMALTTEDNSDFLIPVFSDVKSLRVALDDLNNDELDVDVATGEELLSLYYDDGDFLGLAINPPEYDYVLFSEDVETIT